MKHLYIVLISFFILSSCGNKDDKTDTPPGKLVDPKELEKASQVYCSTGQQFRLFTDDLAIQSNPFPTKTLFGIQKGNSRCALTNPYDEGGLWGWLHFDFSGGCLENGVLWTQSHYSEFDGNKVTIDFTPLASDNTSTLHLFTNRGHRLNDVRQKMGLLVYKCAN